MLSEDDVNLLVKLLGKVASFEKGLADKKVLLLDGLSRLIEGDGWIWSLSIRVAGDEKGRLVDTLSGGPRRLFKTGRLPASDQVFQEATKKTGRLPLISICQVSEEKVSRIMLGRRAGAAPFSAREKKMARVVCEEIGWLHESAAMNRALKTGDLSPRRQTTLALLAQGLSRGGNFQTPGPFSSYGAWLHQGRLSLLRLQLARGPDQAPSRPRKEGAMTPEKFMLGEKDVRAMVKLLGHICALEGPIELKKQSLMAGLCRLIDADMWVWVHAVEMVPDKLPVYVAFIHGGFGEEQLASYLKIQTHPEMARYSAGISRELVQRTNPLTRSLAQIVPTEEFFQSAVGEEWRACGIYPFILSYHPLQDGTCSGIGIYRNWKKGLATEREAKIVNIILSEVPWLHEAQGPRADQTKVPQLPVRERLVLELLLQGYSRKAIAQTMGISINTVAGYAKSLYRFFAVNSHTELINRFFIGNGGEGRQVPSLLSLRGAGLDG